MKNPEIFESIKRYQVHAHYRTCWKYNNNECRFTQYFTERAIIAKFFDSKFSIDESQDVLTWRNTLLRQFKSYIDSNFNTAKLTVIYPTKVSFTQPLSIKETLDKLEMLKDNYCKAF